MSSAAKGMKEHQEVLDRQWMEQQQAKREADAQIFRKEEAAENRKWRFREFVVEVIGVVAIVGVLLAAAFIQRGVKPPNVYINLTPVPIQAPAIPNPPTAGDGS